MPDWSQNGVHKGDKVTQEYVVILLLLAQLAYAQPAMHGDSKFSQVSPTSIHQHFTLQTSSMQVGQGMLVTEEQLTPIRWFEDDRLKCLQ